MPAVEVRLAVAPLKMMFCATPVVLRSSLSFPALKAELMLIAPALFVISIA